MKAIQIQNINEEFYDTAEYAVMIDGRWYKVTCVDEPILDGTHANSDNIYKWDNIGSHYSFTIEAFEGPEIDLPDHVTDFLKRFQENGERAASLRKPRDNSQSLLDRYPGYTWGWKKIERMPRFRNFRRR